MGSFSDRMAPLAAAWKRPPAEGTTVAVKSDGLPPARRTRTGTVPVPVKAGQRFDEPWLRADDRDAERTQFHDDHVVRHPGLPQSQADAAKADGFAVFMTFSADPHRGLVAERFNGEAIVFLATVTFETRRTAALR